MTLEQEVRKYVESLLKINKDYYIQIIPGVADHPLKKETSFGDKIGHFVKSSLANHTFSSYQEQIKDIAAKEMVCTVTTDVMQTLALIFQARRSTAA